MASPAGHRSSRRQRQALATRDDIVRAARKLFAERGYAHVAMADIAREADVAVQTIYASVGTKRDLVFAMLELIDDESGVPVLARRIVEAPTPPEALAACVHLTRQMQERVGDVIAALFSAGMVDADAAAASQNGLARHRQGAASTAQRISALGGLRDGMTVEKAAAVIAVMTSTAVYKQFRGEFGWSFDECEGWIVTSLETLLFPAG